MATIDDFDEFYCRFESSENQSDYGEDLVAARFIGVRKFEFSKESFEKGVTAYTLDIVESDSGPMFANPQEFETRRSINVTFDHLGLCDEHQSCPTCHKANDKWFRVVFKHGGNSYIYPTFGDSEPRFVSLMSITQVKGPDLPSFPLFSESDWRSFGEGHYQCLGFEVGQGMATLICNDRNGFLIDAGAGTPIKRENYLAGKLSKNDLITEVANLEIHFVLSHGDADHWRLLGWDDKLRGQVTKYIVPDGVKPVALFDKVVKGQVVELSPTSGGMTSFVLGNNQSVRLYRTAPHAPTSNNDGIIVVFNSGDQKALIPGDCVYSEMMKDTNCSMLLQNTYAAIVVPHHGDDASANNVPNASSGSHHAVAFFSAGNHATWDHPRQTSLDRHDALGYRNHQNKYPTGINAVTLLP
jgi:beta-lactamase superfamily II metal-dependent hydrolase